MDLDAGTGRAVSDKRARAWAASKGGLPHFDTSAKDGVGVEDAFVTIARAALKNEAAEEAYMPSTVNLNPQASTKKAAGCC